MGFTEVLTIIFVLLKVFHVISWSWLVVFLPEIIGVIFYIIVFVTGWHRTTKFVNHFHDKFDNF